VHFDATLPPADLDAIPSLARAAEAIGFAALWVPETQHNPFLPGALIAEHTQRLQFGTAIAVAFARSPATLAYTAWDLAQASAGRFILGLGTQVKAHIERRFGMPWPESPASKLRDQIGAVRALWQAWQSGEKLDYRSDHYKLTLMSPFFNPGPIEHPDIPIYVAGVNTGLACLAGEIADGFLVHPLHTPRYLREVILPAIEAGAAKAGRARRQVKISVTALVATDPQEKEFTRSQVAFYASTPSYRAVMALHGWEPTAATLSRLAARGRWEELPALVDDGMLDQFSILAPEADLPGRLVERYRGLADRLSLYTPFVPGQRDEFWRNLLDAISE